MIFSAKCTTPGLGVQTRAKVIRAIGCLSLIAACSSPPVDQSVVARVGEVDITFEDVLRFKGTMPALLLSEKEGVDALDEYLQSMIDLELLLLEAQPLAADSSFAEKWAQERDKKLFAEFIKLEIQDKIDLSQEEIKRQWSESKWSRLLKLARIRSATANEAEQVLRQLEDGTPFAELSGPHLTHRQDGRHQGVLESYFGRGNLDALEVPLEVAEAIFDLAKGEVSAPLAVGGYYDLYKVLDERPAPASYYLVFSQGALLAAHSERRRALVAELMQAYEVELDARAVVDLAANVAAGTIADMDPAGILGRYNGGQIAQADFNALYPKVSRVARVRADSSGLDEFVRLYLLPEVLFPLEIEHRGLAQEPQIVEWLEHKKRAMLVDELRTRRVEAHTDLSEDALRRYYEANLHRFMADQTLEVREILVATRTEAEALAAQIQAGADMGELAAQHSIRQGQTAASFHLHSFERVAFGELLTAAIEAEVGVLTGPVEITATEHRQGGFSLFEVLHKTAAAPKPYDEVEKQVRYWWTQQEENRLYNELLGHLREKHAAHISIYRDHLAAMYDSQA